MTRGDRVVHLHAGALGTIAGVNEIGWLQVAWDDGEVGVHPAQHLELAYLDRDLDRWLAGRS